MKKFQIKLNKYHLYWLSKLAEDYFREYLKLKIEKESDSSCSEYGDLKDVAVALQNNKYLAYDRTYNQLDGFCKALQLSINFHRNPAKLYITDRQNLEIFFIEHNALDEDFRMMYEREDFATDLALAGL